MGPVSTPLRALARVATLATLACCDRAGATRARSEPSDGQTLYASQGSLVESAEDGDHLILAFTDGSVERVGKDGSAPQTIAFLEGRRVRAVAPGPDRIAVIHFAYDEEGHQLRPPGQVDTFGRARGAAQTLVPAIGIISYVAADAAGWWVLDEADDRAARLRRFGPTGDALEVPVTRRAAPYGLVVGSGLVLVHLHEYVEGVDTLHVVRDGALRDLGRPGRISAVHATGDGFVAISEDTRSATAPGRGELYFEHPAKLFRLDPHDGSLHPLGTREIRNGQGEALGPTHTCIVEYFPERPSVANRDVLLVRHQGGSPRTALAGVPSARCIAVDTKAAYVWVGGRGLVRFALEP